MQTFATEAGFTDAIDSALAAKSLSPAVRAALTAGIGAGEADARDDATLEDGALNLRIKDWVLREQDVPVTEMIAIAGAAATALLAPGVVVAGAVVTALTAFAALVWKAWRKGAKLSQAEVAVLGFLQTHGPMSLDELKAKAPAALPELTATAVEGAIKTLQDVELRDGDIVELIRTDAAGQWRTKPI